MVIQRLLSLFQLKHLLFQIFSIEIHAQAQGTIKLMYTTPQLNVLLR